MNLSWLITQDFGFMLFNVIILVLILLFFPIRLDILLLCELVVLLLLKHNFLQLKQIILICLLHLRILLKEYG
jgi:hypothetical protein